MFVYKLYSVVFGWFFNNLVLEWDCGFCNFFLCILNCEKVIFLVVFICVFWFFFCFLVLFIIFFFNLEEIGFDIVMFFNDFFLVVFVGIFFFLVVVFFKLLFLIVVFFIKKLFDMVVRLRFFNELERFLVSLFFLKLDIF